MTNYNTYKCPSCTCTEFELLPIDTNIEGITLTFVCYECNHIFNITYDYETCEITDRITQNI
jgi:hypothetical protein